MYYKMNKNKKVVITFDSSGEMMVLWDKVRDEIVKTSDPMIYNWFRGKSGFTTPIPFWNEDNYMWKYR